MNWRLLAVAALVGGYCWARPLAVFACEPLLPEVATAATATRRTESADVVLVGTITDTAGQAFADTATVEVEVYYKGDGPAEVTISGFGEGPDCLSPVAEGERLIFYATGDPAAELEAYYLVGLDAVAQPSAETAQEIMIAAGQVPIVPPTPEENIFGLSNYLMLASGTLCLLAVGTAGFGLAFWMRRGRRPNLSRKDRHPKG